jgi:hypothetical protein
MSRIARMAVLTATLLSLFAVGAASAGAVTWDNSGDTHFIAVSGAGTLSTTNVNLTWNAAEITGRATTQVPGATAAVMHLTGNCTGGLLAGQSVGCECSYTFTASSHSGSVTSGTLDTTCGVYLAGIKACHIEGSVGASYTNTNGTTAGVLQTSTGGSLRTTNTNVNCPLGHNEPAHLSVLTYTVIGPVLGPFITRTA